MARQKATFNHGLLDVTAPRSAQVVTAAPNDMVAVCHQPGTPAEMTNHVPEAALNGHLGHGDLLGECGVADVIFFNGQVVTMDVNGRAERMDSKIPQAEALALVGDTIVAVGSNQRVLSRWSGPEIQLIDLGGRALLPGFVDPHAHTLGRYDSLDERQRRVLAGGVTSIGQPGMNADVLAGALLATQTTDLRIRTNVYLGHNTKCDGPNEPEGWYLDHPPDHDPRKMLRVLGVKVFADAGKQSNFCGWAKMSIPLPKDFILETGATAPYSEILLSTETMTSTEAMTKILVDAQAQGLQVVFHVRGDAVLDAVLDAIEAALDGGPNVYRHRIDHVDFIRPDQLARFGEVGALPVVRGRPNACVLENPDVFRGPSSILWLEL